MTEETTIDWSAPLEAYHPDGRIVGVVGGYHGYRQNIHPDPEIDGGINYTFSRDGSHVASEWRIRNRKPTASEHPEYSPELVERMVACLRSALANAFGPDNPDRIEARAILSELDKSKEVDPLVEAIGEALHFTPTDEGLSAFRAELDKRGYAITRKDEAA